MTVRTIFGVLVLTTALVGFLVGASAVRGSEPEERTPSPASASGTRIQDPMLGSFWRPAGSDAERPAVSLRRVVWTPPASKRDPAGPDAIDSLRAVMRLASTD